MSDYVSDEESASRFEADLEKQKAEPSYMHADWEEFMHQPTDIKAQELWLQFTINGETPPTDVLTRMVAIVKKQVEDYKEKHPHERGGEDWGQERFYELLDLAHTNQDRFWALLHSPSAEKPFWAINLDDDMLEKLRSWLPMRTKLKKNNINSIFAALGEGEDQLPKVESPGTENLRQRYRKWVRLNSKRMELFRE